MVQKIVEINCPGCGARVSIGQKECEYCHKPVVISTFNSLNDFGSPILNKYIKSYNEVLGEDPSQSEVSASLAMCYLKLGRYEFAIKALQDAQAYDLENAELLFYEAIALLNGKKAFLNKRTTIEKALECLNAAVMIEPRGVFFYLTAYIKYDYFFRKHLNVFPDYSEDLAEAFNYGVSEYDIGQLFDILKVARPEEL